MSIFYRKEFYREKLFLKNLHLKTCRKKLQEVLPNKWSEEYYIEVFRECFPHIWEDIESFCNLRKTTMIDEREKVFVQFRTILHNVIIVDILRNILECDMAICDLSSRNPNVFYELGFRQAFNMKTVLMKDDQTDRPFDVSTIRSINYESSLRIDLVNKAITELTKALKETNEMSEKEPNSLLKLLSIDNPAKLPDRQKLSLDSSLILQAIQDLSMDMHRSMNQKRIIDGGNARSNEVMLPNGQIAKIGDHIFDNKKKMEIGEIVDVDSNAIFLRNSKGVMELIDIIGPYANNLCVMPF